jgi:hypothetical protein
MVEEVSLRKINLHVRVLAPDRQQLLATSALEVPLVFHFSNGRRIASHWLDRSNCVSVDYSYNNVSLFGCGLAYRSAIQKLLASTTRDINDSSSVNSSVDSSYYDAIDKVDFISIQ